MSDAKTTTNMKRYHIFAIRHNLISRFSVEINVTIYTESCRTSSYVSEEVTSTHKFNLVNYIFCLLTDSKSEVRVVVHFYIFEQYRFMNILFPNVSSNLVSNYVFIE